MHQGLAFPARGDYQRSGHDQGRVHSPATVTERCTAEAVKFIREHRDGPVFLYCPHTAVHTPIHPGAAFQGQSANGRFGDWVAEVDASVGRVLDTLRELKLERNTLVVFTSDGGTAGPLRGGKGSTWEGAGESGPRHAARRPRARRAT